MAGPGDPPPDPFKIFAAPVAAFPNPLRADGAPVKPSTVGLYPPELDKLIRYLMEINNASGLQPNLESSFVQGYRLVEANEAYLRIIEQCSVAYFQTEALTGMLRMVEETTYPRFPVLESSCHAVHGKVDTLRGLVKSELMTDPDEAVKKVGAWARDARLTRATEINGYLQNADLLSKLKWLVTQTAKAPAAPMVHWTDGWLDVACVSLEYAYGALLQSPHPKTASEHVLAMLEKVASKSIDPALLNLVLNKDYVQDVSPPAAENPLTVLADAIGEPLGARLAFPNGMVNSLAFIYTLHRLPSAMSSASIGKSLAPKIYKAIVKATDSLKRDATWRQEWDQLARAGITRADLKDETSSMVKRILRDQPGAGISERREAALEFIGRFNNKDAIALAKLQKKLAGPAWQVIGKGCFDIGVAFLGIYTAADQIATAAEKPAEAGDFGWIRNIIGVAQASVPLIMAVSKTLKLCNGISEEGAQFLGTTMGGMASLLGMLASGLDAYQQLKQREYLSATLSGISTAASGAALASMIATEVYGSAWGPGGLAAATLVNLGVAVANGVRAGADVMITGPERVLRAAIEDMQKPSHPFMKAAVIAPVVKELAEMKEISTAPGTTWHPLQEIPLKSPWEIKDHPELDYEARLRKLGYDSSAIVVLTRPLPKADAEKALQDYAAKHPNTEAVREIAKILAEITDSKQGTGFRGVYA